MTGQGLEGLRTAALAFANTLRGRAGLAPVDVLAPGVPNACVLCTIATTAGGAGPRADGWANGWVVAAPRATLYGPRGGVRDSVEIPDEVVEFMCAFDAGVFPDLVAVPA